MGMFQLLNWQTTDEVSVVQKFPLNNKIDGHDLRVYFSLFAEGKYHCAVPVEHDLETIE